MALKYSKIKHTMGEVIEILKTKGFDEQCPEVYGWVFTKGVFRVIVNFATVKSMRTDMLYEMHPTRFCEMRTWRKKSA